MAVELDDSLGGAPTQHRELQGAESDLFLSYFPNGIRLKAGGVKSGFTIYDPEDVERRLFKVKGNRNVHVSEVSSKTGNGRILYIYVYSRCLWLPAL